jgi:thiamine-monophosphate kinase
MPMLDSITENRIINSLASKFCRSPLQQNLIHESDAEIIKIRKNSESPITVTIDSISEEIETGLYDDPYLIGWMLVMVNFSDIAATGAEPVGILISEILPDNLSSEYIENIQSGINDAVNKCGSYVLGGDTNSGKNLILTGCALGRSSQNKYLKRISCQKEDILYSTGCSGRGNAYAVTKLINRNESQFSFYPAARLKEALIIRDYASCCMDTSDGVISTLDQLTRLNNCGFELVDEWIKTVDEEALSVFKNNNLPDWLLMAGQHGEFELLFTIPPEKESEFLNSARSINWVPVKLGNVIESKVIRLKLYGRIVSIDSELIRNLPHQLNGDVKGYLQALLEYDRFLRSD